MRAAGADCQGYRYSVQLVLTGVPYRKPKHTVGHDIIGIDLGPSTIAVVPRQGSARLEVLCAEVHPSEQAMRRLQRKMRRVVPNPMIPVDEGVGDDCKRVAVGKRTR